MAEEGIDVGLIRLRIEGGRRSGRRIIHMAKDYDVVVGESKPSVHEVIFGRVPE